MIIIYIKIDGDEMRKRDEGKYYVISIFQKQKQKHLVSHFEIRVMYFYVHINN